MSDDPLATARGAIFGQIIGTLLWLVVFAAIVYFWPEAQG
jgi:hypothetical protein